ncbi:MAG TPA: S8 family serine peptidase, partial [Thermoanaerobaculia bacterium]|nr:S8 family serine peptidase [Thermoanaerobaculia bacterium]
MLLSEKEIEYLIFGTERQRRFTQDSPVLPDVWLEYNNKGPDEPVDLLLTPYKSRQPSELFRKLRERLRAEDEIRPDKKRARQVTYNEAYVVAKLTLDEVIRVALPLTRWWVEYVWKGAEDLEDKTASKGNPARKDPAKTLRKWQEILNEHADDLEKLIALRRSVAAAESEDDFPVLGDRAEGLNPSGDLMWMIEIVGSLRARTGKTPPQHDKEKNLEDHPVRYLPSAGEIVGEILKLMNDLRFEALDGGHLLWAVQRNRDARNAIWKSSLAVKADAARRLFEISCKGLRWGIIDSGIDASHPAFRHDEEPGKKHFEDWLEGGKPRTRVVEAYDFTRLRALLDPEQEAPARLQKDGGAILFDADERRNRKRLQAVRRQVEEGRMLDWGQLAKLIRVRLDKEYRPPRNPHGTHVAGILGGRWRRSDGLPDDYDLEGMCPDIQLIDLRVLDDKGQSDEFTVLAALQFVRYLNGAYTKPYVQGVNMSLSLLHNVMNYACGRTPVCDECHRLISSGTVVVAAAGNEGYGSFLTSKGTSDNYRDISITDPGNAEDVITVGATHRNRPFSYGVSYFSSRGPTGDGRIKPDLVAPGEKITGPVPDYKRIDTFDGTSMA